MSFYTDEKSTMINSYLPGKKLHFVEDLAQTPKANLVIVHGLAEYVGRYDPIASYMVKHDYNVFRYDQPGHSFSYGERGYIASPAGLSENLKVVVDKVKRDYFDLPTFVLGHSMGGETVLLYGAKHPGEADALAVSDPVSVEKYPSKGLNFDAIQKLPAHQPIPNAIGEGLDRDQRIVDKYIADPYVLHELKAGIFTDCMMAGAEFLRDHAKDITDSILYLQGLEDGLIDYRDSLATYQLISAKDKELHVYPKLMHEVLNDSERKWEIYQEIDNWFSKHIY
ncbi:MAG: alpha/beta hydrolase [Lactobacillus sp.]